MGVSCFNTTKLKIPCLKLNVNLESKHNFSSSEYLAITRNVKKSIKSGFETIIVFLPTNSVGMKPVRRNGVYCAWADPRNVSRAVTSRLHLFVWRNSLVLKAVDENVSAELDCSKTVWRVDEPKEALMVFRVELGKDRKDSTDEDKLDPEQERLEIIWVIHWVSPL